jgi:hypothetical protein
VNNCGEIMMYQTEDGLTKIEAHFRDETVWLSLDKMAELFQRDKSTVSRHIKNIFSENELDRNSTVAKFATVQGEGSRIHPIPKRRGCSFRRCRIKCTLPPMVALPQNLSTNAPMGASPFRV